MRDRSEANIESGGSSVLVADGDWKLVHVDVFLAAAVVGVGFIMAAVVGVARRHKLARANLAV